MPHDPTKLVLGRGEVYFDRFIDGTRIGEGERYLGNTSSFRVQRNVETRARATSYGGKKVNRPETVISESHSVDFITENIDTQSLAMWFGAEAFAPSISLASVSEDFVVKRGRFYQLGKSQTVAGTRGVANVVVRIGSTVISATGNYSLNITLGRIEILPFAVDLRDGDTIRVTFEIPASNVTQTTSLARQVSGALRFVAFNEGYNNRQPQNDYYLPFVTIAPRGQVDMKGDEWQQWGFEATAFNLTPTVQQVYVTTSGNKFLTYADEEALVDEFGSLNAFPYWEDQLNTLTNVDLPPSLNLGDIYA